MPKIGMISLTLKKDVYDLLKAKAREAGMGVNQYLENLLIGQIGWLQDRPGTAPNQNRTLTTEPISSPILKNRQNFWWGCQDLNLGHGRPRPVA